MLWLSTALALALTAVFLYGTEFGEIANAFRSANYLLLVPALSLYFLGVFMRAARWHFLLRSIKPIKFSRLFQITVIGYMANNLLPFRIGEVARAIIVGNTEGVSRTSTLVTIVLERVFDGITLVLFIGIASIFLDLNTYLRAVLLFASILFATALLVLVLFAGFRQRFDHFIHRFIKCLPERFASRSHRLVDSFFHGVSVLRNPTDAIAALVLSALAWICEAGMYSILALGFGLTLIFPIYLLATAVANLVTVIPSTPGYLGVFDAPIRYVLEISGVNPSVAASYTILLHAALIIPIVLLGLSFTCRLGISLAQLKESSRREALSQTQ